MKITGQSELINSQYNRDFQLDQARMAMRDKLRDIKSAAMDKLVSTLTVVFVPSTFAMRMLIMIGDTNDAAF